MAPQAGSSPAEGEDCQPREGGRRAGAVALQGSVMHFHSYIIYTLLHLLGIILCVLVVPPIQIAPGLYACTPACGGQLVQTAALELPLFVEEVEGQK